MGEPTGWGRRRSANPEYPLPPGWDWDHWLAHLDAGGDPPKGPWQKAVPSLRVCVQHKGGCAYRQGDPERCDICHADWDAVETRWQDAGTREEHAAGHQAIADRVSRARAKERVAQ